ncbi:hypothetical protein [Allostreptomyces psammosilenae]|uniref:Uncharacterized protein n=1 Tax=Allostreptomyces psammosilenae TaxID=1892865 RepID=A0A852ZQ29_9ACTN|nr:hypothetical protein [Allostreptomyces psammosilenae]NYI04479.1 hypothetical protein [Allostreptomyces psammosilenae]
MPTMPCGGHGAPRAGARTPRGPAATTGFPGPRPARSRGPALALATLLTALAALLGAGPLGGATPARAATGLEEIGAALRDDPVYVEPSVSDRLPERAADDLTRRIDASDVPIYVAVLPDDPAYGGEQVFERLRAAVGRPGVYAVALGSDFGAASDSSVLPGATAQALATANLAEHDGDLEAVLDHYVADVSTAVHGTDEAGTQDARGGGTVVAVLLPLLILALAAGAGGLYLMRANRRRRDREREELARVRTAVDEDITAYGEALDRLDFTPTDPDATPEALDDYRHALDAYDLAKRRAAAARRPQDVRAVTEALEDGRFRLAVLDARRHGRPLPQRRPPCFFDPRHGPSVRDVEWTPDGGTARTVPVCAADATRLDDGLPPVVRTVPGDDGGRRPYWEAGPAYGPWAGGYFAGYGATLLPSLLVGTMLGSALYAPGPGWYGGGAGEDGGDFGGGFGDGGGGDVGGGDFGGGFGGDVGGGF